MKYEVYEDKAGEYRWRLKADNGQNIANGGEGYKQKADCLHGIELVKKSGPADVVELPKE
ncbi:MAG: YegP family protein [Opitutales bacterium]